MSEHFFTEKIKAILEKHFPGNSESIFNQSSLIQYLNNKTKSAIRGSKSRSSFANIYAVYILVEDYIKNNFHKSEEYKDYAGAIYSDLFKRQRELPFGARLQNHALNNRLNSEFQKWFPALELLPVLRVANSERYWINESLLKININGSTMNISETVIEIIDEYISTKKDALERFLKTCTELQTIEKENQAKVEEFIISQLAPNVDARLFEIVSYAILKYYYSEQSIFWGFELETISEENLKLFKTGRTNANDGGIDFVMQPLGRFFQVTETLDFRKYFLDIEKLQRYPITFVIKSEETIGDLYDRLKDDAIRTYTVALVVDNYMRCIEEIINIPLLKNYFSEAIANGYLGQILNEIIVQSRVEFNYDEFAIEE